MLAALPAIVLPALPCLVHKLEQPLAILNGQAKLVQLGAVDLRQSGTHLSASDQTSVTNAAAQPGQLCPVKWEGLEHARATHLQQLLKGHALKLGCVL